MQLNNFFRNSQHLTEFFSPEFSYITYKLQWVYCEACFVNEKEMKFLIEK